MDGREDKYFGQTLAQFQTWLNGHRHKFVIYEEHVEGMQNYSMDHFNRNTLKVEFELVLSNGADELERMSDHVAEKFSYIITFY